MPLPMFILEAHDGQVSRLFKDTPEGVCTVRKSPEGAYVAEPVLVGFGVSDPAQSQDSAENLSTAEQSHTQAANSVPAETQKLKVQQSSVAGACEGNGGLPLAGAHTRTADLVVLQQVGPRAVTPQQDWTTSSFQALEPNPEPLGSAVARRAGSPP